MTNQELRTAYYNALLALFKTSPNTPENLRASEECGRLYDMNPALCDDVDDALADDLRMGRDMNAKEPTVTPMNMSMFKPYRFRLSAYGWTGDYTLYSMPEGWILVPDSEHLPARRLTEKHADQILRHSKYLGRGSA